ncbi:MAG TPA: ThuA domain-containing protein [Terriglobales bacterium]|nr:ThuA domain-containing protein [Terriglobales bacterium]
MNRRDLLRFFGSGAMGLGLSSLSAAKTPARKRILMFTKSSGFEHDMVKRSGGNLSPAEQIVTDMGQKRGIEVTATKDGGVFSQPALSQYDAFFFYTTGDLTTEGQDKNPPMTPEGKQAFLNLIRQGKGFIGTHSATDTFEPASAHTDPQAPASLDPYVEMIGAEFVGHGQQQKARSRVADPRFPGMQGLGQGIEWIEEWYALRAFPADLHVLLVMETESMQGNFYQRPPYPNTWARMYGQGRVFYTALGHREDVWSNPAFQALLTGAMAWAVRDVNAHVPPDLERVTPHANDIPAGAFAHQEK